MESNNSLASSFSTASTPEEHHSLTKITRRTSPFMQYFETGKCKLCGREFRGLKASNGKRHLEMKHPVEYQQVLEHKRRAGTLHRVRKSLSTICSTTDEDEFRSFGVGLDDHNLLSSVDYIDDDNEVDQQDDEFLGFRDFPSGSRNNRVYSPSLELDAQIKECVIALEAAARPLRRLALFAASVGLGSEEVVRNKHLKEILKSIPHLPIPSAQELEQQINLEISDVLLRIHRTLNSLPSGFCVSTDVIQTLTYPKPEYSMGIVAHFWSQQERPETAALDIIHLNGEPSLEYVAETLKHAFDKTDLNGGRIYRTIVESSAKLRKCQFNPQTFVSSALKIQQDRNYSQFCIGSCAAYRLRLTIDDVFTRNIEHTRLQKKLSILLDYIAGNSEALGILESKVGRIPFPQNLDWSSWRDLYYMLGENTVAFNQICHDQKWSPFTRTDIQTIAGFFTLEKPISEFARKLETNQIPTSSLLFPGLKRLLHELKVNSANSHLSHLLLTVLSSRFVEVLTSIDEQADPFYLAASFLDPTIAFTLGIYEHAASRVIKTMCSRILNNGAVPTSPSTRAVSMLGILSLPPAENLAILEDLDREIQDYLREFIQTPWTQGTAYDFWRLQKARFPALSQLAPEILVVPATSYEARRLLEGLEGKMSNREQWKRALLVYNDPYICV